MSQENTNHTKKQNASGGAGFKPVSPKVDFPKLEEEILKYWKENKIFEKSIESRPKDKTWTILDGPPFITGLPHYGTLLSSLPKDVFPRYKTMKGYRVRRVWGWDCHGLPAENKVEKKLGIKRKKDIEEVIGVKKFIDECKLYVSQVSSEWEWYVLHVGRWVDFKNAYKTMDTSYMESVMWVFKQMYDKGHIYKGLRVSLYCPHCGTPISNFEVAMDADNHKETSDLATTYKYQLKDDPGTFVLAWSTTPWNKLVTLALAVNPKLIYVKVKQDGENYILAKTTLKILKDEPFKIIDEFSGKELIGKKFVPHFDFYKIDEGKKAFEIIGGDFVTAEEGTGVVTIAAYGEEDLAVMQKENIQIVTHLDDEGNIKSDVPKFGGMYYLKANKAVNEDLASRNLVYKEEEITHTVPLCWRCHTRLYFAPQNAWFVNVGNLKDKMKETNEKVNWFPKHFKYGRFLKSLEAAPDWNISRSRYWGSPVPVWECECGERFVPGSIKELEEASGKKISDLHKPEIDEVTVKCKKCGKDAKRVPEVLDSWIEAGSASFAERHFPFEKDIKLEDFYPPDFIAEYTGQIRAWFYVLHVIGAALYDSPGFKNVLVEGVILGTDGRKMSKNYGNYPDPKELLQKYGGDALRLYLLGSPVMKGEDIVISEEEYRGQVRGMMLILWNSYSFFVGYANNANWDCKIQAKELSVLDKWILSRLTNVVLSVNKSLEEFDTMTSLKDIENFVLNDFSTWYIRRSRDRVGPTSTADERNAALSVMYGVLVTLSKLLAPLTPFIAEEIYRNLTDGESVHLEDFPKGDASLIDLDLEAGMATVRSVVEAGHATRKRLNIKVRQPLSKLWIAGFISKEKKDWERFEKLLKEELNVKEIDYSFANEIMKDSDNIEIYSAKNPYFTGIFMNVKLNDDLIAEGKARDIVRKIQEERKNIGTKLNDRVDVQLESWPKEFEQEIKNKALVNSLSKGEFSVTLAK